MYSCVAGDLLENLETDTKNMYNMAQNNNLWITQNVVHVKFVPTILSAVEKRHVDHLNQYTIRAVKTDLF